MLDSVLNIVKEQAMKAISNNSEVPAEKREETIQTATHAVADGLQQNLNLGNMSNIASLFGSGSGLASNPIVNNIEGTVVNALVQKVGLSQGIASTVATTVINAVVNALSHKVNDPNDKGFNLESIVGAFTGGKQNGNNSSSGNILSSLGKLFG